MIEFPPDWAMAVQFRSFRHINDRCVAHRNSNPLTGKLLKKYPVQRKNTEKNRVLQNFYNFAA
jgi:hypothetical protein